MGKGKLLQQRRVDNEEKIRLLQEAIAGKTSLECLLEGDKKWSELTEYQQGRLFRQASAVLFYLELINQFHVHAQGKNRKYLPEIQQMACDLCPFKVSPRTLQKWHVDFTANGNKFSECLQGKWEREWLLEQHDLKLKAVEFLNHFDDWSKTREDEYLNVGEFQRFLNEELKS